MIDVVAYVLKFAGVAFLLVAAVGVLRLPDAFTRMHAATKAGTLGAGLVVLGAALSLESAMGIATALVTLLVLLLTVPLASHSLGRAAYIGGAAFWRGTEVDKLSGTLPRGDASLLDDEAPGTLAIDRVLVAPTHESDCTATSEAVEIARALKVPLACLGIIDPRFFEAAKDGQRLARVRVESMLERAASLGVDHAPMEVAEANPRDVLKRHVRKGDLVVLPSRGWYDHGAGCEPDDMSGRGEALMPLARSLTNPVLLASEPKPVERVSVVDDGSDAICSVLAMLSQRKPFGDVPITVSWAKDVEISAERRAQLSAACPGIAFCGAPTTGGLVPDPGDVVVTTSTASGRADWYGLDWRDRIAPGWRGQLLLV